MVTYLNRFSTKLADLTSPLRELTKKHVQLSWEPHHQQALNKIKQELCSSKLISYYDPDPTTPTILQCDASQTFDYYLLGRSVTVETDRSPLEQIFKKNINEAPSLLQRLLLRCLRFDVHVHYKQGRSIPVADALSRVCHREAGHNPEHVTEDSAPQRNIHFISTPIDLAAVKFSTAQDHTMNLLKNTVFNGWPPYWKAMSARTLGVLELSMRPHIRGWPSRTVMTASMRNQVLQAIRLGHQGKNKCMLRARQSVFWPGISAYIRHTVKNCDLCNKHQPAQPKLPILQPDLPTRAWEKLGTDIFEFNRNKYLMIVCDKTPQ